MRFLQLLVILLLISTATVAQEGKSVTTLLTPASEEDQAKLSIAYMAKVEHLKKVKAYKQVQLVKVGNLAKIQKEGVLTFTLPGDKDSVTFFASQVMETSETDFSWVGASADKLSNAFFICKNGNLSGSFSVSKSPSTFIRREVFPLTKRPLNFLHREVFPLIRGPFNFLL
jgi:hypothetical protein